MNQRFGTQSLASRQRPARWKWSWVCWAVALWGIPDARADEARFAPRELVTEYCIRCHGEHDEIEGDVDLVELLQAPVADRLEQWQRVMQLIAEGTMPPEDEPSPRAAELHLLKAWWADQLARYAQPRPGKFRPRRLSAIEYRNTLHSLLGFPLLVNIREAEQTVAERSLVMKLLPTDPPGPSGFTNDTSANSLSDVAWEQYAYLADVGLDQLFSPARRAELSVYLRPGDEVSTQRGAQAMLRSFMRRAYRRSVPPEKLRRAESALAGLTGAELEAALRFELKVVLMSPAFLYQGLQTQGDEGTGPVDSFELAERLSYFLWADTPDDELLQLAASGRLQEPRVLRAQVDRLLAAPRARRLAEVLGDQWFSLGEIRNVSNNPPIADALQSQPLDFLDHWFRGQLPLLDLIDSRTTFINSHTAKFYPQERKQLSRYRKQRGIEVESLPNQRVLLEADTPRGGLLTMPGILAMNRGPILRGTWMLERVLGETLPEPPPDVGQVPPSPSDQPLTFRQRFEQHRSQASCAVCHDKIDPLGFALGRYDGAGNYVRPGKAPSAKRKKRSTYDEEGVDIDTRGQLPSGEHFANAAELKQLLAGTQRSQVLRNIVRRTLAYALCRKLEVYDIPTVDAIVKDVEAPSATFRELAHAVVASLPFRQAEFAAAPVDAGPVTQLDHDQPIQELP